VETILLKMGSTTSFCNLYKVDMRNKRIKNNTWIKLLKYLIIFFIIIISVIYFFTKINKNWNSNFKNNISEKKVEVHNITTFSDIDKDWINDIDESHI
jgi:uncharacterized protein involved in cysteine biosynthesis